MSAPVAPAVPRALVHATAVALFDATVPFGGPTDGAVLLTGDSGSGKSDIALRLIAAGGKLVSDDQTELFLQHGRVFADAPAALSGAIEIRGVGIMHVERAPALPVILAVRLGVPESVARLPEPDAYALPASLQADVKIPLIMLNGHEASTPAKIAAAAAGLARGTLVAGAVHPRDASSF